MQGTQPVNQLYIVIHDMLIMVLASAHKYKLRPFNDQDQAQTYINISYICYLPPLIMADIP